MSLSKPNGPVALVRSAGALLLLLFGSFAPALLAHPFLDDRLVLLNEQIVADPSNSRLLLSRGSLLLDERHAHEALADFERALELDPELSIAHLLRAQALLADGQNAAALATARHYLELEPGSAKGWRTLVRIHEAESVAGGSDALDRALAAFERYFEVANEPRPDDYLERAALQRRAGQFDLAVRGLEDGVERLGPLSALLRTALEIERERGKIDSALAYAERLAAASPQEERWLLECARLLAQLDRGDEALAALGRAEAALAGRSTARRSAPALAELAHEIDRLRSELAAPPPPGSAAGRQP